MAAHQVPWDEMFDQSPVKGDKLGQAYDAIEKTRGGVRERIAQEHSFDFADTGNDNQGKHLQGSARAFVTDTPPDDASAMVVDDGDYEEGRLLVTPTVKDLLVRIAGAWVSLLRGAWDAIFGNVQADTLYASDVTTSTLSASGAITSTVANGTAPLVVTSATVVTNLNADKLDGFHAGHASGQIPISDGTVCTNLNASRVAGYAPGTGATQLPYNDSSGNTHLGAKVIPTYISPTAFSNPAAAHMATVFYVNTYGVGSYDFGARAFHGIRIKSSGNIYRIDAFEVSAEQGDLFIGTFT